MSVQDRIDHEWELQDAAREPVRLAPLRLPPGMTWRAGPDQIGHLLAKPRDHWYLCGFQATTLRLAWPATSRCAECVAVLRAERRV